MFKSLMGWVNPDLSNFEDDKEPFTEFKVTLQGTGFSVSEIGHGTRALQPNATLETVQAHLEEIATHLEAKKLVLEALNSLVVEAEPSEEPIQSTLVQEGLDACGFPKKGASNGVATR